MGGSGYSGPPAANQTYTPNLPARLGAISLRDSTSGVLADSINYSTDTSTGVVISPLLNEGEGSCPANSSGAFAGAGQSMFRWPNGADTDSNCNDFRVQAATTTAVASAPGASDIKITSRAAFALGQRIMIDTGANAETALVAMVGTSGATTTAAAIAAGATSVPIRGGGFGRGGGRGASGDPAGGGGAAVGRGQGVNAPGGAGPGGGGGGRGGFSAGQTITIDSGANYETAVVVTMSFGGGQSRSPHRSNLRTPMAHRSLAPA